MYDLMFPYFTFLMGVFGAYYVFYTRKGHDHAYLKNLIFISIVWIIGSLIFKFL